VNSLIYVVSVEEHGRPVANRNLVASKGMLADQLQKSTLIPKRLLGESVLAPFAC
jgi:hypothetical protein